MKISRAVESAAWSAARFVEIYAQLKEMDGGDTRRQDTEGLLRREAGILNRRTRNITKITEVD
jgi:hypothetical protein